MIWWVRVMHLPPEVKDAAKRLSASGRFPTPPRFSDHDYLHNEYAVTGLPEMDHLPMERQEVFSSDRAAHEAHKMLERNVPYVLIQKV